MLDNSIFNIIASDKLISCLKNNPTVIYGAGNTGKDVYNILKKNDYKVECFIDNNRFNTQIEDKVIYNLETIKNNFSHYQHDNIIVAIFNRDVDIAGIILQLKEIGFKNIFTFVDFYQQFETELKDRFWLSNAQLLSYEQEKIQQAYSLLSDDESKQIFESLIKFRATCDYHELNKPLGLEQQYFPKDITYWTPAPRFIDAGAYDGDTIRLAVEKNIKFSAIFCLEPDMNNYQKLVLNNSQFKEIAVCQIPCGLWSESTLLKFDSLQGEGSRISNDGNNTVSVVALDDVIVNYAPTQIKMDIEGAELAALAGAKNTILKYQPNLVICVYHKPKDLWEIPIYIERLNLNYKLYLRNYGFSTFDTVLYCVK